MPQSTDTGGRFLGDKEGVEPGSEPSPDCGPGSPQELRKCCLKPNLQGHGSGKNVSFGEREYTYAHGETNEERSFV